MKKKKKGILIIMAVILALILIAGISAYAIFKHYYGMMTHETLPENPTIADSISEDETEEGTDSPADEIADLEKQLEENLAAGSKELPYDDKDVYNVLLVGTDSRENNTKGRSDSMILISINRKEKRITMTSLMRDIWVSIPDVGNNRLNASYAFGGPALLLETIEANLGVHIDRYVQVNFYAFMDVIDTLGGVDLEISADEIEVMNRYLTELNRLLGESSDSGKLSASDAGMRHLSGKQALAYCRIRYLKGGEYERTRRQRDVLNQIFEKAKGSSLSELNDLLNILLPNLTTNVPEGEMLTLVLDSPKLLKYNLESNRIPVEGTYKDMRIEKRAVIGIDFSANRLALQEIIYGTR